MALLHTEILAGVYLHDPTTLIAAVNPSLMTYTEGVVRVQTVGITKGLTVFDNTKKRYVSMAYRYSAFKLCSVFIMENSVRYWFCRYGEITAWTGMPTVKVADTVDAPAVVELMMQRLMTDD